MTAKFSVKVMSYNVDTPEKDWDAWKNWRKVQVVDIMTKFNLEDFYGLQETKNGGGSEICDQIRDELNRRNTGKIYDYISIKDLNDQEHNPGQDCENSIFFDSSRWVRDSFGGKFIYKDWDPRYAFYGVFHEKSDINHKLIIFNTHAPAGNYPGSHNGYNPDELKIIAAYVDSIKQTIHQDAPVIFTGDWNGNIQGQSDFKKVGLEACRIKAGQKGDTGPTWPSGNPSEGFDQILAGQQGMDWAKSFISVLGRNDSEAKSASDHLPIEAELYFQPLPELALRD